MYIQDLELESAGYADVTLLTFKGIRTYCKVVDVYDADTCYIIMRHPWDVNRGLCKIKVRLAEINAPEIRNAETLNDALASKKRFLQLIVGSHDVPDKVLTSKSDMRDFLKSKGRILIAELNDFDKFGRVLAFLYEVKSQRTMDTLHDTRDSFNYILHNEGFAEAYMA